MIPALASWYGFKRKEESCGFASYVLDLFAFFSLVFSLNSCSFFAALAPLPSSSSWLFTPSPHPQFSPSSLSPCTLSIGSQRAPLRRMLSICPGRRTLQAGCPVRPRFWTTISGSPPPKIFMNTVGLAMRSSNKLYRLGSPHTFTHTVERHFNPFFSFSFSLSLPSCPAAKCLSFPLSLSILRFFLPFFYLFSQCIIFLSCSLLCAERIAAKGQGPEGAVGGRRGAKKVIPGRPPSLDSFSFEIHN